MNTKTYKAESMMEALQLIQNELGPDAVVLSAREVPLPPTLGKWKRSGVEVVAVPAELFPKKAASSPTVKPAMPMADDDSKIEWVSADQPRTTGKTDSKSRLWQPTHISKEEAKKANRPALETEAAAPAKPVAPSLPIMVEKSSKRTDTGSTQPVKIMPVNEKAAAQADLPKGLRRQRQTLLGQGLEESFVERATQNLASTIGSAYMQDEDLARKYFTQVLEAEVSVLPGLAHKAPAKVICLVGPSGSGKTSTTAKLALYYGRLGKKVAWICADTVRTGAISQAQAFAGALNLPFQLAYTPGELKKAVQELSEADLILVDTAGYNPMDERQMVELGSFLTEVENRCTLLVVPATMKENDALSMASALGLFGLNGTVITKLDETGSFGNVFDFARRSQLPYSYFSTGKETTGDLEIASTGRMVRALFGKGWLK